MTTTQYRIFISVYVIVWVALVGLLWYLHEALNYWLAMLLGALLVGGIVPSIKHLKILFARDEKVRMFMDDEKEHTRQVIERSR